MGKQHIIKATAAARIVLWRGGSVWLGQAEGATEFHDHHAIQIALGLDGGRMRFRLPGEDWREYGAVLVAAHQPHAFEALGDPLAFVFVEPETREGRAIRARHATGLSPLALAPLQPHLDALASAWRTQAADTGLMGPARAVVATLAASDTMAAKPLDRRIGRAIEQLRAQLDRSVTLAEVAAAVHLSPERFRHLFVEETGIRFRPYVLWLRLEVALAAYTAGASLTAAASAAGFADSAHFARTFKRMFGIAATSLRPE